MPPSYPAPSDQPALRMAAAFVCVVLVAATMGLLAEATGADPLQRRGSGTLVVDGVQYEFASVTCAVSDDEFEAAGMGHDQGQDFWVSASNSSLDLTVGTGSPDVAPADDEVWLVSDELIDWTSVGQTVVARASMSDQRAPGSATMIGALELRCDDGAET